MTIDEAIEKHKLIAKSSYETASMYADDNGLYARQYSEALSRAQDNEQIADWLEELKLFKELYPDADVKGSLVTNYNNGWNDGIDELADGLCCQACFTNAQKDAIRKLAEEFKNKM